MTAKSATLDAGAIALSALCLVHCLALPLFASTLPVLGTLAEAEWVHRLLVFLAAPIPIIAVVTDPKGRRLVEFAILAFLGIGMLLSAAFIEALHDHETAITVVGACILSVAHIRRWAFGHKPIEG